MGGKRGKDITDVHRDFIVRELACYSTPGEAVEALKAEFGIEISPQRAENYDPNKKAGAKLSKKWRAKFAAYRKGFLEHAETRVPEAHKAVRVHELAKLYRRARGRNNDVLAADHLERIAKEMGNVHTNKREFTGKDGGPMQVQDVSTMTYEQLQDELRVALQDPGMRVLMHSLTKSNEAPAIPPSQQKEQKDGEPRR